MLGVEAGSLSFAETEAQRKAADFDGVLEYCIERRAIAVNIKSLYASLRLPQASLNHSVAVAALSRRLAGHHNR